MAVPQGSGHIPKPPNPFPRVHFFILQLCGNVPTGAREFKESPEENRGKGLRATSCAVRMLAMKGNPSTRKVTANPCS